MNKTHWLRHVTRLSLLMLFAALAVATTASAAVSGGVLPGKLCGSVSGAAWKFQGQTGTRYNVTALPAGSCRVGMKSVGALTKQQPRAGALGSQTLSGPGGFRCAGSGIPLAHAGFCGGSKGVKFFWAPRLKK